MRTRTNQWISEVRTHKMQSASLCHVAVNDNDVRFWQHGTLKGAACKFYVRHASGIVICLGSPRPDIHIHFQGWNSKLVGLSIAHAFYRVSGDSRAYIRNKHIVIKECHMRKAVCAGHCRHFTRKDHCAMDAAQKIFARVTCVTGVCVGKKVSWVISSTSLATVISEVL